MLVGEARSMMDWRRDFLRTWPVGLLGLLVAISIGRSGGEGMGEGEVLDDDEFCVGLDQSFEFVNVGDPVVFWSCVPEVYFCA